jgi:hypothetical protein
MTSDAYKVHKRLAEKLTHLEQSIEPQNLRAKRTTVGVQAPHWLAIPRAVPKTISSGYSRARG